MRVILKLFIMISFVAASFVFSGQTCFSKASSEEFSAADFHGGDITTLLSYDDLAALSREENTAPLIKAKMDYIFYTPIVDNSISKNTQITNSCSVKGEFLRVASWNIDRGLNIDYIKSIFLGDYKILEKIKDPKVDKEKVKSQIDILSSADIIILNEVDIGMPRTGYRNIVEELAHSIGYNYAFGTEFIEVDPANLGLEKNKWSEVKILFPDKEYVVDKKKYKGLHGDAILSRFPLKNARIFRYPQYYDWFNKEKVKVAEIEFVRREAAEKLFREDILREVRRGSRIALIAEAKIPGVETPVTVIANHLENRVVPKYRHKQIQALLNEIKDIKTPVIFGGDFNTTSSDGSPTSIRREIAKRLTDPQFMAKQIIYYAIPYSLAISSTKEVVNFLRINKNPTARNFPIISPNSERKLFITLQKYKFTDEGRFDFSGNRIKSSNNRAGLLANSNQRDLRGFTPTFIFQRPLILGKFKLDWIFVKPASESNDLSPMYGRTLLEMNYAFDKMPSDHSPVTADLPFEYISVKALKQNLKQKKKEAQEAEEP